MKCFTYKIMILLLGGLIPPVVFSIINSAVYNNNFFSPGFSFFYLVGILLMIRFGIYSEVSGKINERYKKG